MINIMIDTEIWVFNKKLPLKEKYDSETDFKTAMNLHEKAVEFFKTLPKSTMIYFSIHQLGELFHALAFRGLKLPLEQTKEFMLNLFASKNIRIIPLSQKDIETSIRLSVQSKIHIWDYLCIIPLTEYISQIYTNDIHFKDDTFSKFGIPIENPLQSWQQF